MVRGAPDYLLPKCKHRIDPDGNEMLMDEQTLQSIENKMQQWSLGGRRLILFCKRVLGRSVIEQSQAKNNSEWLISECFDLTFIGLIGFMDPPRPEYIIQIVLIFRSFHLNRFILSRNR